MKCLTSVNSFVNLNFLPGRSERGKADKIIPGNNQNKPLRPLPRSSAPPQGNPSGSASRIS